MSREKSAELDREWDLGAGPGGGTGRRDQEWNGAGLGGRTWGRNQRGFSLEVWINLHSSLVLALPISSFEYFYY